MLSMQSMLAMAQVTLTTNELPYIGMSYTLSEDTSSVLSPGNQGQGQTWNFTQLQFHTTDTILFEDAATSPYAAQFPASNLVSHNSKDSVYGYYTTNSNGFYLDGGYEYATAATGGLHFSPPVTIIPVPFTYGDTHISHARLESVSVGTGTGFKLVQNKIDTLTGDGAGTLMLPSVSYNNTLRIRISGTIIDSIFVDISGTGNYTFFSAEVHHVMRYSWFKQGNPSYLFGMESSYTNPAIMERVELVTPTAQSTGIKTESTKQPLTVYPNPASSAIHIGGLAMNTKNLTIEIYSLSNMKISTVEISKEGIADLSAQNLANGIYLYRILSTNVVIKDGKLMIQK